MENSLKNAVDTQLSIAKLEEKLHITLGEMDTPEKKYKSLLKAVVSTNAQLLLDALLSMGTRPESAIEILKDESHSKEEKESARKSLAFQAGGPVIIDLMETLTLIAEIFGEHNND